MSHQFDTMCTIYIPMLEAHLGMILGCRTSQLRILRTMSIVEGRQEDANSHKIESRQYYHFLKW